VPVVGVLGAASSDEHAPYIVEFVRGLNETGFLEGRTVAIEFERMRRITWLGAGRADEPSPYLDSLRTGLRDLGWIEGRNLTIERFWATGLDNGCGGARSPCLRSRGHRGTGIHGVSQVAHACKITAGSCPALHKLDVERIAAEAEHYGFFGLH